MGVLVLGFWNDERITFHLLLDYISSAAKEVIPKPKKPLTPE